MRTTAWLLLAALLAPAITFAQDGDGDENPIESAHKGIDTLANRARLAVADDDFPGLRDPETGKLVLLSKSIDGFSQHAVKQVTPVWCWAACGEMVNRFRRGRMNQEQLADMVYGSSASGAGTRATADLVALALQPRITPRLRKMEADFEKARQRLEDAGGNPKDKGGRGGEKRRGTQAEERVPQIGAMNSDAVVEALKAGQPVVLGYSAPGSETGHVIVVYGVTYAYRDAESAPTLGQTGFKYGIESFEVVDPKFGETRHLPAENVRDMVTLFLTEAHAKAVLDYRMAYMRRKTSNWNRKAQQLEREKELEEEDRKRAEEERERKRKERKRNKRKKKKDGS